MENEEIDTLSDKLDNFGEKLIHCQRKCEGVKKEPCEGIIPRGLYLEKRNPEQKGVIVVGMNPGGALSSEKEEFSKKENRNYKHYSDFFKVEILGKDKSYYPPIRKVIDKIGFCGPILWTEIVKCECEKGKRNLTLETKRICVNDYLKKEVNETPLNWPIITIGKDAWGICLILFPEREIIGIYHPSKRSKSYEKYWKEFEKNFEKIGQEKLREHLNSKLNTPLRAVHLEKLEGV